MVNGIVQFLFILSEFLSTSSIVTKRNVRFCNYNHGFAYISFQFFQFMFHVIWNSSVIWQTFWIPVPYCVNCCALLRELVLLSMDNIFLYPLEIFFVLKFTMFDVNMDYNLLLISAITYVYHYIWSESTVDNLELIHFFFFWPWWLVCWDYHVEWHSCRMNDVKAAVDFLETWLLEFSGR